MSNLYPTHPISRLQDSTSYPIYPTEGGFVTPDVETRELFIQLTVGTTGSVIVQNIAGQNRYYPVVIAGSVLPAAGIKVVSSATIDGQAVTTTATNIWWHGGK